jgi:V/A-type H+-transporting ATPase subunit C
VPDQEHFAIFLYPNDYHNIKTMLKAEFLGSSADEILTDTGSIPLARLADLVRNRNYTDMRLEMAKGIQEVIDTYATSQDPQIIDLILDRVCYHEINLVMEQLKNDFVRGYIALKIDTINLKSFVRAKEMKRPWDFFSNIYIKGGNIPEKLFVSGYDEALEQFAEKLGIYGLTALLVEGAQMIKETGRFTAVEKLCDNHLMGYARDAKYISYGIQPLVSYLAAKESEIKTARIIMAGKLANISAELIRERIRNTYV